MSEKEKFLTNGYEEIIEIVEEHMHESDSLYSSEEIIEKIIEISENRLMGEI